MRRWTGLMLFVAVAIVASGCSFKYGNFQVSLLSSTTDITKQMDETGLTGMTINTTTGIPWDTDKAILQEATENGVTDKIEMTSKEKSGQQTVAITQAVLEYLIEKAAMSAATGGVAP